MASQRSCATEDQQNQSLGAVDLATKVSAFIQSALSYKSGRAAFKALLFCTDYAHRRNAVCKIGILASFAKRPAGWVRLVKPVVL